MKNKELKDILKKCFGKEKDDRYHAIAMLIIYGIFMLVLVIMIRMNATPNNEVNNEIPSQSPTNTAPNKNNSNSNDSNVSDSQITENINYSYSYTVSYNGNSEVFLGKKVNNKEKFTHIKDGITNNYAVLDDNYLILENNTYHITNNPSNLFKYCDVSEILSLVDDEIPTENNGVIRYQVDNTKLAISYKDKITVNNELKNSIVLTTIDNTLKSIDLDLTNYISALENSSSSLIIHMEFVDIGNTEDFDINIS